VPTRRNPSQSDRPRRRGPPARTLEGRENQLIQQAIDLVERRIQDGTASATEVLHYLKLGSTREVLERKELEHKVEVLAAKVESYASGTRIEELYSGAIRAMREYQGQDVENEE